jgi:hypothetical protein
MGSSNGEIRLENIGEEKIQELFRFLAYGEVPEDIFIKRPPKLGPKKAFSVIYYLQEQTGVLPDNWELCKTCKEPFDSEKEGDTDQMRCGGCMR